MADLLFLIGPARSGTSRRAVEIAQSWGDGVVFIATYRSDPGDAEMVERVRRHRAERIAAWRTHEPPASVAPLKVMTVDDLARVSALLEGAADQRHSRQAATYDP
jgi:adenosyl cobinamide kinase/adenosyl cobinamide phosphate guanylyltransferase